MEDSKTSSVRMWKPLDDYIRNLMDQMELKTRSEVEKVILERLQGKGPPDVSVPTTSIRVWCPYCGRGEIEVIVPLVEAQRLVAEGVVIRPTKDELRRPDPSKPVERALPPEKPEGGDKETPEGGA